MTGLTKDEIEWMQTADIAERHPVIDAAIEEGLADVKAGRLSPAFNNMKEFDAWLKSPEGKNFGKS